MHEFTNLVLSNLADTRWDIGDHEFPANAGWQGPQFTGTFKPFVVVYLSGTTEITGSIGNPVDEKRQSVTLNMFGVSREQLSRVSEEIRPKMRNLRQTAVGGTFIQYAQIEIEGAIQRIDAWDKPLFITTDRYTLFTTKE